MPLRASTTSGPDSQIRAGTSSHAAWEAEVPAILVGVAAECATVAPGGQLLTGGYGIYTRELQSPNLRDALVANASNVTVRVWLASSISGAPDEVLTNQVIDSGRAWIDLPGVGFEDPVSYQLSWTAFGVLHFVEVQDGQAVDFGSPPAGSVRVGTVAHQAGGIRASSTTYVAFPYELAIGSVDPWTPGSAVEIEVFGVLEGEETPITVIWSPSTDPDDAYAVEVDIDTTDLIDGDGTLSVTAVRGNVRYGTDGYLFVRNNAQTAGPVAIEQQIEAGAAYVDLLEPVFDGDGRLTAIPDLEPGWQIRYENVQGGTISDVTVFSDAAFSADEAVTAFDAAAHDGQEWGAVGTQDISDIVLFEGDGVSAICETLAEGGTLTAEIIIPAAAVGVESVSETLAEGGTLQAVPGIVASAAIGVAAVSETLAAPGTGVYTVVVPAVSVGIESVSVVESAAGAIVYGFAGSGSPAVCVVRTRVGRFGPPPPTEPLVGTTVGPMRRRGR